MRRALIVVVAAALVIVPGAGAWTWPVKGPVLQKFVLGDDPYAAGQHRGIDIGAPTGEPVLAPSGGTVHTWAVAYGRSARARSDRLLARRERAGRLRRPCGFDDHGATAVCRSSRP